MLPSVGCRSSWFALPSKYSRIGPTLKLARKRFRKGSGTALMQKAPVIADEGFVCLPIHSLQVIPDTYFTVSRHGRDRLCRGAKVRRWMRSLSL